MKVVWGDVAVVVQDAKASAKWWKKLGFEVRDNVGHWITIAPPGSKEMVLHLCGPDEGYAAETGNTGIAFFVDELDKLAASWKKKGVRFTKDPVQESASKNATFADPDGNEYWLFEDEDLRAKPKRKAAAKKPAKKKTPAKKRR